MGVESIFKVKIIQPKYLQWKQFIFNWIVDGFLLEFIIEFSGKEQTIN